MTRVSLKEAYDNKDVIAQIYAIRDTAESAVDTSERAVNVANGARQHVDELVPQVEQAVVNANTASASAQASAQTVAGYENRLATVEDATEDLSGDLNAVTLRVTTAEGDIVTIQGRVTALETADGQNVKINRINDYAVGLTGNQTNILGNKEFKGSIYNGMVKKVWNGYPAPASNWVEVFRYNTTSDVYLNIEYYDTTSHYMHVIGECNSSVPNLYIVETANNPTGFGVAIAQENGDTIVYIKTPRERNHTVTITAHDRYRNPLIFTSTSDAGTYRETLPAISVNVIV